MWRTCSESPRAASTRMMWYPKLDRAGWLSSPGWSVRSAARNAGSNPRSSRLIHPRSPPREPLAVSADACFATSSNLLPPPPATSWIRRDERGFDPAFLAALRTLHPGELSQPALSSFGYHIIRVDAARGDSLHVRHILIPLEPQGKHLEYVESRADTLDKLAAERPDGSVLDTLARALSLPLGHAPPLVEGERMVLGQYVIPDVSVWAFEARVGETSPVIEARPGYYVFRLDSLVPAGSPPLSEIRGRALDAARLAKKREVAARRADQIAQDLGRAGDLTQLAAAHGLTVQKVGPFTRLVPPAILQDNALAVGAAFGLRPGARSGLIRGATGYAVLQGLRRTTADSIAWLKQKDARSEER